MTATNHVLTGSIIGFTISQPLAAIPLAFLSHFLLDALPHYGDDNHTHKRFLTVLLIDMLVASLILLTFAIVRPDGWILATVCAVAAASPDLMWLPMWIRELKHVTSKPLGLIARIHKKIQWAEKSHNYPVEVFWTTACMLVLVKIS